MELEDVNKTMGLQSLFGAIVLFVVAICYKCFSYAYFGIDPYIGSLICSIMCGVTLIIAFDYYNNGVEERPFGLIPLYLIGIILGVIIYYLVIVNVPMDLITQAQSFLKIEAVR